VFALTTPAHDLAAVITILTKSAAFLAPSFFMIFARWSSMVRGLMPRLRPAFLVGDAGGELFQRLVLAPGQRLAAGEMQRFDLGAGVRRLPAHISVLA
jgi:hypothetical protein